MNTSKICNTKCNTTPWKPFKIKVFRTYLQGSIPARSTLKGFLYFKGILYLCGFAARGCILIKRGQNPYLCNTCNTKCNTKIMVIQYSLRSWQPKTASFLLLTNRTYIRIIEVCKRTFVRYIRKKVARMKTLIILYLKITMPTYYIMRH